MIAMSMIHYLLVAIALMTHLSLISGQNLYDKCVKSIYQNCYKRRDFTAEEVENARLFIQQRYQSLNEHRPVTPPCQKLHIRRDFKCLTNDERLRLLKAINALYDNGVMTRMAHIHWRYWGQIHKFAAFIPWHRWFLNEFDKQLKLIDPHVSLPYWSNFDEFDQPHLSLIWNYFGRAGDRFNDHCIRDSPFSNMSDCIRRQWTDEEYIPAWNPIEFVDSVLQRSRSLSDWFELMNNPHLKIHLNIGGWAGQMSVTDAPYDPVFYLYHEWLVEIAFFKWQLQNKDNLVPITYNEGIIFDSDYNKIRKADLTKDKLPFFNVSVLEAFQVGFGQLCYIHDHNIVAINQMIKKKRNSIPTNYYRLPDRLAQQYYPNFHSGNYTSLHYVSEPMMNCNRKCRRITVPEDFGSSLNGRRLLHMYKYMSGLDLQDYIIETEFEHSSFIADLNSVGYCSPYIIS